jgi:hypothetical protein
MICTWTFAQPPRSKSVSAFASGFQPAPYEMHGLPGLIASLLVTLLRALPVRSHNRTISHTVLRLPEHCIGSDPTDALTTTR